MAGQGIERIKQHSSRMPKKADILLFRKATSAILRFYIDLKCRS
jgi:hypothetical protein